MKNHIVIQFIKSLRKNKESFEDVRDRVLLDNNELTTLFSIVQNDFNDVNSLRKYIKKLQEDK